MRLFMKRFKRENSPKRVFLLKDFTQRNQEPPLSGKDFDLASIDSAPNPSRRTAGHVSDAGNVQ
jgi:hypothetical protein